MLVSIPNGVLLVPSHHSAIRACIPHAKPFKHYTVVPHRIGETIILRNLGLDAPSPIQYHYTFKSRYPKPFSHQIATSAFLTLNPRAFVLNDVGCVDAETEYLSPTGWRRMDAYDGGRVAQYHIDGRSEFIQPTEYVKKPCLEMYRFLTKYGVDQKLSSEHRVFYVSENGTPNICSAKNIADSQEKNITGWRGKFLTTFKGGSWGLLISCDLLRLQVAVIADGHFPNKTNRVVVRLKKERKKIRLREILERTGIAYKETQKEYASAKGFSVFTFQAPRRVKEFDAWFWNATQEELWHIADESQYWDGSFRKAGACSFTSYVKTSADFIQYAFAATGRTATLSERYRESRGKTEFTVFARAGNIPIGLTGHNGKNKTQPVSVEPTVDGFKYCFMVPTSLLVFRRNGKIFISGNTAKTLSAYWAADYLMSLGLIRRVLVVSPLSTLEPVHGKELFQSFPHRSFTILHGVAAKRKALALADFDFYIINHDGVEVISKILAARSDIDLVIIDEIGAYRNGQTARWKALNSVLRPEQRVWGMTGTPTPNEPTDAYSQVRLVRPGVRSEYSSFTAFKTATMNKVSMFKFAPKPDAMDRVYAIMQPAIRFSRDECLDLPECLYETRDVELTAAQRKAYTEMVKNLTTEVSGGKITALNEAIKLMRLMQIVSGVAYDVNAEHQQIDCAPRTKVLKEIVEEAGQKVIVYVPFQGNLTHLKKELDKVSTCAVVYGLTPIKERNETFHAFQNYPNPRVLIAHPGCMSHGLNLQAASTIVWWAPVNSNDIYTQANGRINRAGQKNAMTVFHLASTEIERNVYKRLELKQKLQGLLLDMIRGYESN